MVSPRLDPGPRPPPDRTFWELLPRRNLRRALFLVLVLLVVLFVRHTGGLSLSKIFDTVAPASSPSSPSSAARTPTFQHLEVRR